jgi:hypothetical protein
MKLQTIFVGICPVDGKQVLNFATDDLVKAKKHLEQYETKVMKLEYSKNGDRLDIDLPEPKNINPDIAIKVGMIAGFIASDKTDAEKIEKIKEVSAELISLCMES